MCQCSKKGILIFVAIAALLGISIFHHCGDKATVVDFKRVWVETDAYKTIMKGQAEYNQKLRGQFETEAEAIRKESQELLAQKSKLGESAFKKKATAIQQKADELEQRYALMGQKGEVAAMQALEILKPKAQEIVNSVAKKSGASVLLNKDLALYVDEDSDLTDEIIQALNKKLEPVSYPDPEKVILQAGEQ